MVFKHFPWSDHCDFQHASTFVLSFFTTVVLRSYIAGLRDQLKEFKVRAEHQEDDPHAHYHGHERCTSDHDHSHNHQEPQGKGDHDDSGNTHEHNHDYEHKHAHEHDRGHKHEHAHEHGHGQKHEHKYHDEKKEGVDEIPAWKKRVLEKGADDPMVAPFGGSWNAESSLDATK